jgi:hypothetical protein
MTPFRIAAAALLLAAPIRSVRADEPKAPAPKQMSPAEQQMMEKYVKAATPGPEHQKLAKLAGKWKLQVTAWMAPGAPPQKSDGTAEFTSVLGGRYLQQEVKGSMAGEPFEGRGIEGYDNVTNERFGTWTDSMSTGLLVVRGKCAAEAKKCTFKGTMPDALAGKLVPMTETITYTDDDHFSFEMHGPGPGGKNYKMIEIAYSRQ